MRSASADAHAMPRGVAVIATIGLALLVVGAPPLVTAYRATHPMDFACDAESLRALERGDWVRLTGCDTDMFHGSSLAGQDGQRTHNLLPVREHDGSVDTPSGVALAVPTSREFVEAIRYTSTNADDQVYGLSETLAVAIGPLDWIPAIHLVHEEVESGVSDGAQVLELRAVPDIRAPAAATGLGAMALICAGILMVKAK